MSGKVKQLDFTGVNIYAGIDTHLKNWRITIMTEDLHHKTFSSDPSAKSLACYLRKNFPNGNYYSAYEAGFCGYSAHRSLLEEGIKNIVVNPADVPTKDKERKQKEDSRDSRKIARALINGDLEPIYIPTRATEELRGFIRYRKSIVRDISRYKARIKSFLYRHGIDIPDEHYSASRYWSSNFTEWLKTIKLSTDYGHIVLLKTLETVNQLRVTLLQMNRELRTISGQEQYKTQIKHLTSIPGIGIISAMTILAELETMLRFSNLNKLCSYIGLVPTTNSSSDKERAGGLSPRCNRLLREVIVESAWVAARNDPALSLSYSKLCTRMKKTNAIIRIAKKLLGRVRFVLINEVEYKYAIV